MSKRNKTMQNTIPAIWLIGLGLLWLFDLWWPGILILVGITLLVGALSREQDNPPSPEPLKNTPADVVDVSPIPETKEEIPESPPVVEATSRLPKTCPMCGAPVNERNVKWLGPEEAHCNFCDSQLPLGLVE